MIAKHQRFRIVYKENVSTQAAFDASPCSGTYLKYITVLVVCGKHSDATTNAEVGLAKKYSKVLTTLDGVLQAAEKGEVLTG